MGEGWGEGEARKSERWGGADGRTNGEEGGRVKSREE